VSPSETITSRARPPGFPATQASGLRATTTPPLQNEPLIKRSSCDTPHQTAQEKYLGVAVCASILLRLRYTVYIHHSQSHLLRKSDPLADENQKLRRANERLTDQLRKAEIVIDVQKKLATLLGLSPEVKTW
jgi:hypothetical protein